MKTQVVKLRKDGHGIQGTLANAEHHATAILPYIAIMRPKMTKLGFATYRVGHNVHILESADGRKFTLRAFTRDGEYVGIRLAARLSRSKEFHLFDIDDITQIPSLLNVLRRLAHGMKGDVSASLISDSSN